MSGRSASGVGIAVIGCGNIGSQTVSLLGGIDAIECVLLVDPDRYEASNVGRQRFPPADIGKLKVRVLAKVLGRLAPQLDVVPLAQRIEAVPLGDLREKVLISCVDSRSARVAINRASVILGTPWVDAGLDRDGQVRARAYLPQGGDCMECAWSSRDYELLEQRVPCAGTADTGSTPQVGETAAAQELGAIAAGLQVALLRSLLSGRHQAPDAPGRQWFYDVASGRGWTGIYTPNPACRLDHARWAITDLARGAAEMPLRAALALQDGDGSRSALAVEGQVFVHRLRCPRCGVSREAAGCLHTRIAERSCRRCSATMTASAADVTDVFTMRTASARALDAPLSGLGLVDGDIFTLRSAEGTAHYHLRGKPPEGC